MFTDKLLNRIADTVTGYISLHPKATDEDVQTLCTDLMLVTRYITPTVKHTHWDIYTKFEEEMMDKVYEDYDPEGCVDDEPTSWYDLQDCDTDPYHGNDDYDDDCAEVADVFRLTGMTYTPPLPDLDHCPTCNETWDDCMCNVPF